MGELPSQQPPDWWNISGPWMASSFTSRSAAAAVSVTRCTMSEEAETLRRVADQQVLGLLVVVEDLGVVLTADARGLVAAERGVRGVGVVAVRPDAARLDPAAEPVGGVAVARPDARAETVQSLVGEL